jgi:hypothetical protein
LKKELTAEIVAHKSRQQGLEREIHDLKTTVFRKNEELVLLQAQVRHRSDINVMSSGSLSRTWRRAACGLNTVKEVTRLSSKQSPESNPSNGVCPKDVLMEGRAVNTGEDADRFLVQMSMDRVSSDEAGSKVGVKVKAEAEAVVFQERKRNLSENNEEEWEKAEVKRIKQEREE